MTQQRKPNRLFIVGIPALLCACIFGACRPNAALNRTLSVAQPWDFNDPVCFSCRIADTASPYNLTFSLKHTDDFAWMNAFFLITTVFPDMETTTDTLECVLADVSGRWYGGRFGKYHTLGVLYKQGIRFPLPGEYRFEIRHAMREDSLTDITAIGLKVAPVR